MQKSSHLRSGSKASLPELSKLLVLSFQIAWVSAFKLNPFHVFVSQRQNTGMVIDF